MRLICIPDESLVSEDEHTFDRVPMRAKAKLQENRALRLASVQKSCKIQRGLTRSKWSLTRTYSLSL